MLRRKFWILLFAATIAVSCSEDDKITVEQGQEQEQPVDEPTGPDMENRDRLLELTQKYDYDPEDFQQTFVQYLSYYLMALGLDTESMGITQEDMSSLIEQYMDYYFNVLKRKFMLEGHVGGYKFVKQCFTYRSVRSNGDSATFSGAVMYPSPLYGGRHKVDGLCFIHQYANMDNNNTLSNAFDLYNLRVMFNQALIFSDTEGFGADYGSYVPYFDGYAKGRQNVDAAIAAAQFLKGKGISVSENGYTENVGVSLGANAAFGTQKYFESAECPKWVGEEVLHDFRTFAGNGPTSISRVFDHYCETDFLYFTFIVPMMVSTMYAGDPSIDDYYSYLDFFDEHANDKTIRNSARVKKGELDVFFETLLPFTSLFSYLRDYKNSMKSLMNSSLYTEDGTLNREKKQVQLLYNSLKKVEISDGWAPEHPIVMVHSTDDSLIPYYTSYDSYLDFVENDGNVVFIPTSGDHLESSVLSMIYASIIERPSLLFGADFDVLRNIDITSLMLELRQLIEYLEQQQQD